MLLKVLQKIMGRTEATGIAGDDMIMDGNDLPECPVCRSHQTKYDRVSGLEHDTVRHKCYVFTLCHCLECNHWFTIREEKDEWDRFEIEKKIEEERTKKI